MKSELTLTTGAAAAMLLAGCDHNDQAWVAQRDTAVCVDRAGERAPDSQCSRPGHGGAGSAFLWYYLARNSMIPAYGQRIGGGSFARSPGATYFHAPAATATATRATYVSRGGFGGFGRSFSAGS